MARTPREAADEVFDSTTTPQGVRLPLASMTPPAPSREELEDDEQSDVGARIRSALASGAEDNLRVAAYRISPDTRKLEFCQDYAPAQIESGDLSIIRKSWGPGDYQLRVIGRRGLVNRIYVSIAAPTIDASVQMQPQQNGELSQALRALMESQSRILEAIAQRPDPMAGMAGAFALMKDMREAMGINVNPVAQAAPSQTAMLGELVNAIKTLREVSDEVSPKPVSDDPLSMLPQILGLAQTAMQNQGRQSAAVPMLAMPASMNPATPASAAPVTPAVPVASDPQPDQPSGDEVNPIGLLMLRGYLQKLCQMASENKSIDEGAEFVYEKLPDDMIDALGLPNFFDVISQIEPKVLEHRAWFDAVRIRAIAMFNEPDPDSPASGA